MISVADGWQHGPASIAARWEPAEVGAAVRELLAKAPHARTGVRHAMTAHPAPPEVQAEWRALGVWTDETLLDRLARRRRAPRDRRRRRAPHRRRSARAIGRGRGRVVGDRRPARRRRRVATPQLVGRRGAVLGRVAVRRDREPDHAEPAPARSDSSSSKPASRRGRSARVSRHRLSGALRDAGFTGTVIEVRGDAPLPTSGAATPAVAVRVDDPAVILWTSGTTSDPKGVVHTHQSLRVEADTIAAAHDMRAGESLLLPMPITHVAGLTYGVLLPVTSGITAVFMDVWEPGRALELLEREHVAVMISTPVFMRTMIDDPAFADTDTSSVRLFSLGGGRRAGDGARRCRRVRLLVQAHLRLDRVPDAHHRPARRRPEARRDHRRPPDRPGRAAHRRPRDAHRRPARRRRASCSRGPEMFVGYLDAALDADAFVAGGWFRTGDLARFDGEHLTIVDRLKDVIIRGGENISAQEVEALLVTHPERGRGRVRRRARSRHGRRGVRVRDRDRRTADVGRSACPSRGARARALQAAVAIGSARRPAAHRERQGAEGAACAPSLPWTCTDDRRARVHGMGAFGAVGASRAASRRPAGVGARRRQRRSRSRPPLSRRARRHRARRAVVAARVRRPRRDTRRGRDRAARARRLRRPRPLSLPRRARADRPDAARARHARAVRALAPVDRDRRGDLVPAVLEPGAGSDLAGPVDARARRGRRVARARPEGVDEPGRVLALRACSSPATIRRSRSIKASPRSGSTCARPASTCARCAR